MTAQGGAARVLRGAAATGLLTLAVLGSGVHSVAAATTGACADDTGVTVVVDFPGAGNVQTRCAGWPVSSGLDALAKAGFSSTPVQQQPQFVCRIDGVPADDKCIITPPGDAYWSYWNAQRGGAWKFSAMGAASTHPAQGSVEGWAFGASDPPEVAPPDPFEEPEPPPSSPPPVPPTSEPQPSQPPVQPPVEPPGSDDPDDADDPAVPTVSATSETPAPSVTSTAAATSAPAPAAASVAGSPSASRSGSAAVAGSAPGDDGSPAGTVVAIGAVVALGAAAGVTAWRRRSAAS